MVAHATAHKSKHENGGTDEISVAGLSGELADNQNAKAHKTSHQLGGGDALSIAGLSGEAADPQPPKAYRKDIGWSSDLDTNLAVVTGKHRVPIMFAGSPTSITIKSIRAMIETVPTGAAIIVDIHKNGTTIFSTQGNRPTIAISANDSSEVTNMDVTTLAKGDYLTLDIDQIGSTIAGQNLVVSLEYEVVP